MLPDGFDYRLTDAEEVLLSPLIPSKQHRIHLKFRCYVSLDAKLYENCVAFLCAHTVTVCCRARFGKLKKLVTIHMFDINEVHVTKETMIRIVTETSRELYVYTPIGIKFARFLFRNALLAMPLLPENLRPKFSFHDSSLFPPFEPKLSLTQRFQFQYNSSCCYRNSDYIHEVTQHFHSLLKCGDGIFDLNSISPFITHQVNIEPIMYTLMHTNTFFGIHCENLAFPNIVKAVGSVVEHSQNLNFIKLVKCQATEGCEEIMAALNEKSHHKVVYWDLSGNHLRDIDCLLDGFMHTKAHIYSIRLEDCQMSDENVALFFEALQSNHRLHGLKQIALSGNRISTKSCGLFRSALAAMSAMHHDLEMFSFGPCSVPEEITTALDESKQPLKHLKIVDVHLSHSSVYDITRMVSITKTLENLELINCSIDNSDLACILNGIAKNGNISKFSLTLQKMKLKKNRFDLLLKAVENGLGGKLVSLSLDHNGIGRTELKNFLAIANSFKVLTELSIAGNLGDRPGTGELVAKLLDLPQLTKLNINGDHAGHMGAEAMHVVNKLETNTKLTDLDISNNGINVTELLERMKSAESLTVVKFDGNGCSFDDIVKYLEICRTSPSLTRICIPRSDSSQLLSGLDASASFLLSQKFMKASQTVMSNRVRQGILNEISMTNDSVLRSVIDMVTVNVQRQFEHKPNVSVHCSIAAVVGLPLPFEPASTTAIIDTDPKEDDTENVYTLPLWMSPVKEAITNSDNTVLYSSLCSRHPSFSPEDRMYAELVPQAMEVTEEEEEGEEEEEEEEEEDV